MRSRGLTVLNAFAILLVVGFVVFIAAVPMVADSDRWVRVRRAYTEATLRQLKDKVGLFKRDQKRYPETLQDLVRRPAYVDPRNWPLQGYLDEVPIDGWERPFAYRLPGARGPFDIVSWGADGKPGTSDDIYR